MANLVLVAEAAKHSMYKSNHIRHLLREGFIEGQKIGGTWLVDLDSLLTYEQHMEEEGTKKFDPTKYQESSDKDR